MQERILQLEFSFIEGKFIPDIYGAPANLAEVASARRPSWVADTTLDPHSSCPPGFPVADGGWQSPANLLGAAHRDIAARPLPFRQCY